MGISVELNAKEITQTVIENTLKMLERRNMITGWESHLKKLIEDLANKTIFHVEFLDRTQCHIYLVPAKLTSIVQGTPLDDFLSKNMDIHKIIIARDVAKKVVKQVVTDYKNAEFFFESEMLEDLPSKEFIPTHQLLSEEEKTELLSKFAYGDLAHILLTDVMARYYGAKIGDIFRIIRPSITSGKNIFYRKVVNGSWDILFEN